MLKTSFIILMMTPILAPREILYTAMAPGTKPETIRLNNTRPRPVRNARYAASVPRPKLTVRLYSAPNLPRISKATPSGSNKAESFIKKDRPWSSTLMALLKDNGALTTS